MYLKHEKQDNESQMKHEKYYSIIWVRVNKLKVMSKKKKRVQIITNKGLDPPVLKASDSNA